MNESTHRVDQRNNKSQGVQFHNVKTKIKGNKDNEDNKIETLRWLHVLKSTSS